MRGDHFENPLRRAAYRAALVARRVRRQQVRSFGRGSGGVERIYVINLDRQDRRWRDLQRELRRVRDHTGGQVLHLTRRVAAVDSRYTLEPDPALVRASYTLADQMFVDPQILPSGGSRPANIAIEMSREEIAVASSHVKTWELIASGDHEYCLVLEDDVYFCGGFADLFDEAWSAISSTDDPVALDLLYVSFEESRGGAEWTLAPRPLRRPVRGLWQLSGYVLSKRGASKLLEMLPVRGPVDLWLNFAFADLDVFALCRPTIKQRLDLPSSNFYSALPVLSKVGLITDDKAPTVERPEVEGPIFGLGEAGTGVTALATALSMLGLRCCSDVTCLPEVERRAVFEKTGTRVFDAYVNVGSVDVGHLCQLARLHPAARFVVTSDRDDISRDLGWHDRLAPVRGYQDQSIGQGGRRAIDGESTRLLILPSGHRDRWRLLTEFLGCEYPSHRYPSGPDSEQRPVLLAGAQSPAVDAPTPRRGRWDHLPWIVVADDWCGVPLKRLPQLDAEPVSDRFTTPVPGGWVLRDDTFPGNLALFRPSNFAPVGFGAGCLTLKDERTAVREYTSAALSSARHYQYGRFGAELKPAKVAGLVTGMFLHRNSPRQEIDIEFPGNDTTKLLINVYFNPGEEGTRLEYGYRGTPEVIDLGFDAADDYHHYEIRWTPESVGWWVDGCLVRERDHWCPTPIPHLPMQFHINLWHTRSAALAGKLRRRHLPAHAFFRQVDVRAVSRADSPSLAVRGDVL